MQNARTQKLSNIFVTKDAVTGEVSFKMKGKKFTQRLQEIGTDVFSTAHSCAARLAMALDSEIKEDAPYLKPVAAPIVLMFTAFGATVGASLGLIQAVKNQFNANQEIFCRQSFAERFNETHAEVMEYIEANKSSKKQKHKP